MTPTDTTLPGELSERLELIERMIADGRRLTERAGWAYLLWGLGHLAALGWSALRPDQTSQAWFVTMAACGLVTAAVTSVRRRRAPARTALARAYSAVWTSFVSSLFLVLALASGSPSGDPGLRLPLALVLGLLGSAHFASGAVLRFGLQRLVGAGWWLTAAVVRFAPPTVGLAAFALAALLGEVVFGAWLMARERRGGALG